MTEVLAPLEVRLLGDLDIRTEGRTVELTGKRLRSLFGVLAMSARAPVPAEVLGHRIWGQREPKNVRRSVQTLVVRLRGALGADAVDSSSSGYRLAVSPDQIDAVRFIRLLDEARRTSGSDDERQLLEAALALWRGTPFEGIDSDWLMEAEAPRLVEGYLAAVERRADLDMAARHCDGLVAELRELTGRYPARQALWVRLLNALDLDGRSAEALAAYELARRRLAAETGTQPGPELRRIQDRLLAADTAAARGTSGPGSSTPGGSGNLLPQSPLPPDMAGFSGRSAALASLDALLPDASAPSGGPIVIAVISGPGGIGKTALAVHWAHRVQDRFADGHLYVDLRGSGPRDPLDPVAALELLLGDLGLLAEETPAGLEARSALFRSRLARRRMLVMLDNARDAAQVRPLLPGATSMVVVTSRSQLRGLAAREHANRIDLNALTLGDAGDDQASRRSEGAPAPVRRAAAADRLD